MTHIELNLDAPPFHTGLQSSERWQKQAAGALIHALAQAGWAAKNWSTRGAGDVTVHNAILVTGPRGAGKTVFLKNAKQIWDEQPPESHGLTLHFCKEIDPTLLVDHDNFANVIIAHLFNEVSEKLQHDETPPEFKQRFYKALEDLARALGSAEHSSSDAAGIDRIIRYRSGIRLERHFYDFTTATLKLIGADAIVMPIDDVDMALGRAFEVLDVVRRLLGCPALIPLVSGDLALYRPIIDDHFLTGGSSRAGQRLLTEQVAGELAQAYLTKLFPVESRVQLLPLADITSKLHICEGDYRAPASQYFGEVGDAACPLVNGEENSRSWPQPRTARELEQLCRILPPSFLEHKEDELAEFWYRYQTLATARHHSAGQLTAEAERIILGWREGVTTIPRLAKLDTFDVLAQSRSQKGEANEKPYFSQLDQAITAMRLSAPIERSQRQFIVGLEDKPFTQRSMPMLEVFTERLQVPKFRQQLSNPATTSSERNLFALYCHHAMYGTSRRTSAQVFFGRPFELLILSLLLGGHNEEENSPRVQWWITLLEELVARPPFHSIYSLAPTKTFDAQDESTADEDDAGTARAAGRKQAELERMGLRRLAVEIVMWEERWRSVLRQAQNQGLCTLMQCVFNKVFTQTYLLRISATKIFQRDKMTDVATRFEYIVINAFATFLKVGVVQQNIAHTPNVELLRNPKAYGQKDPSFRDNVVNWIGARGRALPESATLGQHLMQAIWTHPLFDLHRGPNPAIDLLRPELDSDELIDKLQELMPRGRKALDGLSVDEVSQILSQMQSLAAEYGTDLKSVYAKQVRGRTLFNAMRAYLPGSKE